jgi:hypothetical protein
VDIEATADRLLRDSGYNTQPWISSSFNALLFEDSSVLGFVFVFADAQSLLDEWRSREHELLANYSLAFRNSGDKAWNIYSVMLSEDASSPELERSVSRIEENLKFTRKIARSGVTTANGLKNALYPLLQISSRPQVEPTHYEPRLRQALELNDISAAIVNAFLGEPSGEDLVRFIEDLS